MAFTYDVSTDRGKVRLLVNDTEVRIDHGTVSGGPFQIGETITGGTTGATGTVSAVNSKDVRLSSVTGTFQVGETITGGTSGATATTTDAIQVFDDARIDAFLTIEDDNIKRAAALGLQTIATNQVLVLKVISIMDLRTDGAAVARELRQQANALRQQADAEEANEEGGAFDIAELVYDDFTFRERIHKQNLRTS